MATLRPAWCALTAIIVMGAGVAAATIADPSPATQSIASLPDATLSTPHRVEMVAGDLRVPWELAFLPDGRAIFTERDGHIRLLGKDGAITPPLLRTPVAIGGKMGMLGLALDPEFSASRHVYLAYDYVADDAAGGNPRRFFVRVARYRLEGDRLIEPKVLIEDIPAAANHTGCRLAFGPDGKLYITTGDADEPPKAQQLDTLHGKILRLNRDGSIPSDNPFVGRPGARGEIWSYGHRNPQGLVFDPTTATLFETEHGPNGGDEVNIITRAANYGWPTIDHARAQDGMRSPLFEFTPSIAPGKAILYRGAAFPELRGKLVVALLRGEGVMVLDRDGNRLSNPRRLFARGFGRIRAVTVSPEGYLYLTTSQYDPFEGQPRPDYDMIFRIVPEGTTNTFRRIEPARPAPAAAPQSTATRAIATHCAACHGPDLRGGVGPDLINRDWRRVTDIAAVKAVMRTGLPDRGMPANADITPPEIDAIADFITNQRRTAGH